MILSKDTFKAGRQYSKDTLTGYFADADIDEGWIGNKKSITVISGSYKWVFVQNHNGKYELAGMDDL